MSNSIGNLSVAISANADPFAATMKQTEAIAKTSMGNVGDTVAAAAEKTAKGFQSKTLAGLGGNWSAVAGKVGGMWDNASSEKQGNKFVAGFAKVKNLLKDTAGELSSMIEKPLSSAQKIVENVGGGITTTLFNMASDISKVSVLGLPIGTVFAAPFALAGAAVGVASTALGMFGVAAQEAYAIVGRGADRIKEVGNAANRTGVPVKDFQIIAGAIGGDMGVAEKALIKFQVSLTNAGLSGLNATNAFTRLGLSAQDLAKGNVSDAFRAVVGRLNEITSPAMRAQAAFEMFGKHAGTLMPAIAKGLEAWDKGKGKMDRFGTLFTDADLAMVREMDKAKKDMSLIKDGLTNQFTLAAAPIMAGVSKWVQSLNVIDLRGMKDTFFNAAEWLAVTGAKAVAIFTDTSLMLEAWKLFVDNVSLYFVEKMSNAMMSLADPLESLIGKEAATIFKGIAGTVVVTHKKMVGAVKPEGDGLSELEQRNKDFAEKLADNPAVKGVQDQFASFRKEMNKAFVPPEDKDPFAWVRPRIEELRKDMTTPGEAFKDKLGEVFALRNAFGEKPPFDPKDADVWKKGIESVTGAFGVKLNVDLEDVRKQWNSMPQGAFQIAPDLDYLTLAKAANAYMSSVKMPEVKNAGAVAEGSTAAYSAILKATQSNEGGSIQEQLLAAAKEAKAQRDAQIAQGKEIAAAIKDGRLKLGDID